MSMSLREVLTVLRINEGKLALVSPSELLWSPSVKPPLREAVYEHQGELAQLLLDGDVRVCASPRLHRESWRYDQAEKRFVCDLCVGFMQCGIVPC